VYRYSTHSDPITVRQMAISDQHADPCAALEKVVGTVAMFDDVEMQEEPGAHEPDITRPAPPPTHTGPIIVDLNMPAPTPAPVAGVIPAALAEAMIIMFSGVEVGRMVGGSMVPVDQYGLYDQYWHLRKRAAVQPWPALDDYGSEPVRTYGDSDGVTL